MKNVFALVLLSATAVMIPAVNACESDTPQDVCTLYPAKTLGIYASTDSQIRAMQLIFHRKMGTMGMLPLRELCTKAEKIVFHPSPNTLKLMLKDGSTIHYVSPKDQLCEPLHYVLDLTNITIKLKHEWIETISTMLNLKELHVNFSSLEDEYEGITWPKELKLHVKLSAFDIAKMFAKDMANDLRGKHSPFTSYPVHGVKIIEDRPNDTACYVIAGVTGAFWPVVIGGILFSAKMALRKLAHLYNVDTALTMCSDFANETIS